jgi:peptidoglycan hydrolase-like protein with peptidoglycan-binding domain
MQGLGAIGEAFARAQAANDRASAARAKQAEQAAQHAPQAQQAQQAHAGQRCGGGPSERAPVDAARQGAARDAAMKAPHAQPLAEPRFDGSNRQAERAADAASGSGAQRRHADRPERELRKGVSGPDVRALQRRLNAQGARLREDGRFGRKTERAVRDAQRRMGVAADGVVGPDTRAALERAHSPGVAGASQEQGRRPTPPAPRGPGSASQPRTGADPAGGRRTGGSERVQPGGNEDTRTVAGAARFLLNSPNVKFWNGLSTGSDRKNLERLARGERAMVDAQGHQVAVNPRMMQALAEMARRGPIQINALTGGVHSHGSQHYRGNAVDLSTHVGNAREIERIAQQFGGRRNHERTHIHLSF